MGRFSLFGVRNSQTFMHATNKRPLLLIQLHSLMKEKEKKEKRERHKMCPLSPLSQAGLHQWKKIMQLFFHETTNAAVRKSGDFNARLQSCCCNWFLFVNRIFFSLPPLSFSTRSRFFFLSHPSFAFLSFVAAECSICSLTGKL